MSQINVNTITGKDGGSAVNFPNGITVTGVVTATTLNQNVTGNVTAGSFTGPLTGTASIASTLAAGATGADLTLSGNLTVNGTTTTIDTAVTAVDSLAVDGDISAGTKVLAGLTTTTLNHPIQAAAASNAEGMAIIGRAADDIGELSFYEADKSTKLGELQYRQDHLNFRHRVGEIRFATGGTSDRLIIDQHGTSKFKGPLTEKCHYDQGGGLQSDYHHDLITHGNVYWSDTAAAGAFTFNLRGSATVALNDMMDTGESLSFWLAHACHSDTSRYLTIFKVDNTAISGGNIIWAGGSAPTSAGGGSGTKDVYTFTVFKVGNASFRAFAAQTNHT